MMATFQARRHRKKWVAREPLAPLTARQMRAQHKINRLRYGISVDEFLADKTQARSYAEVEMALTRPGAGYGE